VFLAALTRHGGSVPKAGEDMEQDGLKPPSRAYAYKLRQTWQSRQAPAPAHLTRVK
jgi:hypothetical protein